MPKHELILNPPILNAAGTLGFTPNPHGPIDLGILGAFITNPISLTPRTPARGPRWHETPGGFLLHTGLPNPGLRSAIRRYAARWARARLPVLIHFLAEDPEGVAVAVRQLEEVEGVFGIELGLPPGIEPEMAAELVQSAIGELPVVVRLPLNQIHGVIEAIAGPGVSAISLGPPRGALSTPGGEDFSGRLYGPALFPLALAVVRELVASGIPVIGAGGVYATNDAQAMLSSGALAVQLDGVLWRGSWPT